MDQNELFIINILSTESASGTADLKMTGHGDDGWKYAIKSMNDHPLLPATEWFCYRLGDRIKLPIPNFRVVKLLDGTLAFGSKWESGANQFSRLSGDDQQRVLTYSTRLSAIFGYDLFLPNVDRHADNILFHALGPRIVAMAFDFSRAWLAAGIDITGDLPDDCNTLRLLNALHHAGLFCQAEAKSALAAIAALPDNFIDSVWSGSPDEWLPQKDKSELSSWWKSPQRQSRIDAKIAMIDELWPSSIIPSSDLSQTPAGANA